MTGIATRAATAHADDGKSQAGPGPQPDGFAVSPDIGPVPATYVPRSPRQASTKTLVQHAVARAARLTRRLAAARRDRDPMGGTMPDISAGPTQASRCLMDYQLQVVTLSVTDVGKAAAFYTQQAGFTLDVDYHPASDFRVAQLAPPASACSIQIGTGLTDAPPGSARCTYLAVTDIEAAHRELTGRGVPVSGIRHKSPIGDWNGGWQPGTDPGRREYASLAGFADPDGNTWVIQEIGYHPPGGTL